MVTLIYRKKGRVPKMINIWIDMNNLKYIFVLFSPQTYLKLYDLTIIISYYWIHDIIYIMHIVIIAQGWGRNRTESLDFIRIRVVWTLLRAFKMHNPIS